MSGWRITVYYWHRHIALAAVRRTPYEPHITTTTTTTSLARRGEAMGPTPVPCAGGSRTISDRGHCVGCIQALVDFLPFCMPIIGLVETGSGDRTHESARLRLGCLSDWLPTKGLMGGRFNQHSSKTFMQRKRLFPRMHARMHACPCQSG